MPRSRARTTRPSDSVRLGNPPWERIKLQEQEFFAARHLEIATAPSAAIRKRLIEALESGDVADQVLFSSFAKAKRVSEAASSFVRGCGRWPLTAVGDVNTYALFAELCLALIPTAFRSDSLAISLSMLS